METDDTTLFTQSKWFIRPPWGAILWWEKRRPIFNLAVLAAGITSFVLIAVIGTRFADAQEDVGSPFIQAFVYGVLANVCYTLGWITELARGGIDRNRVIVQRQKLFRRGMIFSVVLTLLPGVLIPLLWIVSGFHHIK